MKNNKHYESNGGRDLNRHDALARSEWTPAMWRVHDYLRALIKRVAGLEIDVRFERDRSQWKPGVGNLELTAEQSGEVVVVVGAECLLTGIGPCDRQDLEHTLLGAVCEYLAFRDGIPERTIRARLRAKVKALVKTDPDWCMAQQAKLYHAV